MDKLGKVPFLDRSVPLPRGLFPLGRSRWTIAQWSTHVLGAHSTCKLVSTHPSEGDSPQIAYSSSRNHWLTTVQRHSVKSISLSNVWCTYRVRLLPHEFLLIIKHLETGPEVGICYHCGLPSKWFSFSLRLWCAGKKVSYSYIWFRNQERQWDDEFFFFFCFIKIWF